MVSDLIGPKEVYAAQSADAKPLVLDVRGPKEYASGHVLGAVNIPLGQFPKKLAKLPQGTLVVTYCNMHHRGSSRGEQAAALLREKGYQAQTLDGGYLEWKEAGLPVEEAPQA
jgi:rhodanese-related sulfurtransferase